MDIFIFTELEAREEKDTRNKQIRRFFFLLLFLTVYRYFSFSRKLHLKLIIDSRRIEMVILKTDPRIIGRGGGRAVSYAGMEERGGREEGTES